jgi:hypothetical protein
MANPSVTYTFTNGTTADGTQVSQNFTDLINSLTDGTKSLNIDAITAAGTATFNGNTVIGNASGDTSVVTATMSFSTTPQVDTIAEKTAAAGVTIDGVLLKDSKVTASAGLVIGNETLAIYDEGTFTYYGLDAGTGVGSAKTANYVVIGKVATIYFQDGDVQSTSTSRFLSTTAAVGNWTWPAALTPARSINVIMRVRTGTSTWVNSLAGISLAGKVTLYADSNAAAFSGANEFKGGAECCISYPLN